MMSKNTKMERYHSHAKNEIIDFLKFKLKSEFLYVAKFWSFRAGSYVYAFKQQGEKGEFLYLAYWKNSEEPTFYDQISIKDCNVLEEIEGKIWL